MNPDFSMLQAISNDLHNNKNASLKLWRAEMNDIMSRM